MELVELVDPEALVHTVCQWEPVFSEVAKNHLLLNPSLPFFGHRCTVRLPNMHPLIVKSKHAGINANYNVRITGLDRRTPAGVRVVIPIIEDGVPKERYTVVSYDSLIFTGTLDRKPDENTMIVPYHLDIDTAPYGDDEMQNRWVECRICHKNARPLLLITRRFRMSEICRSVWILDKGIQTQGLHSLSHDVFFV